MAAEEVADEVYQQSAPKSHKHKAGAKHAAGAAAPAAGAGKNGPAASPAPQAALPLVQGSDNSEGLIESALGVHPSSGLSCRQHPCSRGLRAVSGSHASMLSALAMAINTQGLTHVSGCAWHHQCHHQAHEKLDPYALKLMKCLLLHASMLSALAIYTWGLMRLTVLGTISAAIRPLVSVLLRASMLSALAIEGGHSLMLLAVPDTIRLMVQSYFCFFASFSWIALAEAVPIRPVYEAQPLLLTSHGF
eukprot:scaffold49591_cov19-Tisochrysis_lutea.AAC.1